MNAAQTPRVLNNSFDIINPLVIDEVSGEQKRKQPPMVFRSGTREVHNKLEKHRRAHLKECFDLLKKQLPASGDEKKTSNLNILHSALRHIQILKRRERDLEHEMERLAREKIAAQQRLIILRKEIGSKFDGLDLSRLMIDVSSSSPESEHESVIGAVATPTTTPTVVANQDGGSERLAIAALPKHTYMNGAKEVRRPKFKNAENCF